MTYQEFKAGLFARYHYVPNSSVSFVPNNRNKGGEAITFQDIMAMIIDSENVLKKIKNRNMKEAFYLMAQGYNEVETSEILSRTVDTIKWYVKEIKKLLLFLLI